MSGATLDKRMCYPLGHAECHKLQEWAIWAKYVVLRNISLIPFDCFKTKHPVTFFSSYFFPLNFNCLPLQTPPSIQFHMKRESEGIGWSRLGDNHLDSVFHKIGECPCSGKGYPYFIFSRDQPVRLTLTKLCLIFSYTICYNKLHRWRHLLRENPNRKIIPPRHSTFSSNN